MEKQKRRYAPGCWGDSTFGHARVRERLAWLVQEYDPNLADRLRLPMSDDAGEEDDALEILNKETDTTGLVWEFVDGDLMLSRLISENTGE
jgi:hypothetical protein